MKFFTSLHRFIYKGGNNTTYLAGRGEGTSMTTEQWQKSIEQYEKLIFTICYQMVHDYHEAQNLTQETFLSAYTHKESCQIETVKPWLARIATNKAKDYLKSAYFRKERMEISEGEKDPSPLPEILYLEKEGMEKIKTHILNLQEPYKLVSCMYFLEGKSISEISKVLQRPQKTVQTQLYRSKKILQKKLDIVALNQ